MFGSNQTAGVAHAASNQLHGHIAGMVEAKQAASQAQCQTASPEGPLMEQLARFLGSHLDMAQDTLRVLLALRGRVFGYDPTGSATGQASPEPSCHADSLKQMHASLASTLLQIDHVVSELNGRI